jgi:hypothetical protein
MKKTEESYEKFYGTIWKHNTSALITIPDKIVKANGWEFGTPVVVMVKKHHIIDKEE